MLWHKTSPFSHHADHDLSIIPTKTNQNDFSYCHDLFSSFNFRNTMLYCWSLSRIYSSAHLCLDRNQIELYRGKDLTLFSHSLTTLSASFLNLVNRTGAAGVEFLVVLLCFFTGGVLSSIVVGNVNKIRKSFKCSLHHDQIFFFRFGSFTSTLAIDANKVVIRIRLGTSYCDTWPRRLKISS